MTRRRQLVVALLDEQGFLPVGWQEARAGEAAPTSNPGPRTEIAASGASEGVPSQPDEGAGAANPLTEIPARSSNGKSQGLLAEGCRFDSCRAGQDPAADWFDAMAAWNSADIAQHIEAQKRKDAECGIAAK